MSESVGGWGKSLAMGSPIAIALFFGAMTRLFAGGPLAVTTTSATTSNAPAPTSSAPARAASHITAFCANRLASPIAALNGGSPAFEEEPDAGTGDAGADAHHAPDAKAEEASVDPIVRALEKAGARQDEEPEVLIATVPDPRDSGLQYFFDSALQGLLLGVEHRGFYRDASWLPWNDGYVRESMREQSEECRLTTPGLVTFRNASPSEKPRRLYLLLVGETPTTGIHQAALGAAIRIAKWFHHDSTRLAIVGPTFSGSADSLRRAIDRYRGEADGGWPGSIGITTGSASGSEVGNVLTQVDAGLDSGVLDSGVHFARTTRRDSDLQCAFLRFARDRLGVKVDEQNAHVLESFALLHESGTEFGGRPPARADAGTPAASADTRALAGGGCSLAPEVDILFPFHVSAIRDAYETMDERDRAVAHDSLGARHTTLDVSLREKNKPLDVDVDPSPKTTIAEDVAMSNLLSEISREGVRYVAIRATDPADAIFLARKIRDVAPDVRLVFFVADILLAHPSFRNDLVGSFVVSPYPFFGTDDLSPRANAGTEAVPHQHRPFNGALEEGIFNAVLANQEGGAAVDELVEYSFFAAHDSGDSPTLPIWFGAISKTGVTPVNVRVWPPCGDLYLGPRAGQGRCTDEPKDENDTLELNVDPDVTPPNLWHFVYLALIFCAALDRFRQVRGRAAMPFVDLPLDIGKKGDEDRNLDLALGRAKYHFYSAIRSLIVTVALAYMLAVQALALSAYGALGGRILPRVTAAVGAAAFLLSLWAFVRRARWYRNQATAVRRYIRLVGVTPMEERRSALPAPPAECGPSPSILEGWLLRGWEPIGARLGFQSPDDKSSAAEASLRQLALLGILTVIVTVLFLVALGCDLYTDGFSLRVFSLAANHHPTPNLTLFVVRNLPLFNGVSPSTTILLALACAYVWVIGRLARLKLAHGLSLISPSDGVNDAVSTPIRFILLPDVGNPAKCGGHDAQELTRVERDLLNAIWRPSTGPRYFAALGALAIFPVTLFALKRPSTLESSAGTILLFAALSLCEILIAATLLQLHLYWTHFELLLKRILAHPLGRAFSRVEGFVRESIDDQISRSPNDLLRLAAAATMYIDLVRQWRMLDGSKVHKLEDTSHDIETELASSLAASTARGRRENPQRGEGAKLGPLVLKAARSIVSYLDVYWAMPTTNASRHKPEVAEKSEKNGETTRDALSPIEGYIDPALLRWLRDAQTFAATVVAILINRHVRQFRYFLYTLTGCALLLVLALSSYAFEPYRLLLTCVWVVMGMVVGFGFWAYLKLEQNTLLSRISGTEPGKVDLNSALLVRVIGWVIIPLLSVAAAQYPAVANTLFAWIEPFSRALR